MVLLLIFKIDVERLRKDYVALCENRFCDIVYPLRVLRKNTELFHRFNKNGYNKTKEHLLNCKKYYKKSKGGKL